MGLRGDRDGMVTILADGVMPAKILNYRMDH